MFKRQVVTIAILLWSSITLAADSDDKKALFESIMPGVKIDSVTKLDNTSLYETIINGEIIYFSADGRYVFQGDVISLETRQNVTEAKRIDVRKQTLASLNEDDMIIYEPKKTEYTLTVFTDIDCGYCRKLHQQMNDYNELGIRIRYMAFPRGGIDSVSYDKAVEVWCANDRHQAMTDAKNDKKVRSEICNSPVKDQYEIGRRLGVTGTPALYLDSGELLPGYVPPKRLKQLLDERALAQL
ncbi:MAG: DsbC family protein [Gammaproteobacteria bacterium]|nr:DsbC family protein [Gammaproteobacteria bacterium]